MDNSFLVHAWEIRGYAKVGKYFRDLFREKLKEKYGSLSKAEKAINIRNWYHRTLHEKHTEVSRLFKIIDKIGISKFEAEKYIIEWCDSREGKLAYNINFPIKVSPLHIRAVSHIIGDGYIGNISKNYKQFVWTQKNTHFMQNLENILVGKHCKRKRDSEIMIPKVIVKIVCKTLGFDCNKFNRNKFLESTLSMPKEYRIQTLTSIIEDEGTVRDTIYIRMGDKKIVKKVAKLIDSLGYERSKIISYWNETNKGSGWMYKIHILSLGRWKYRLDLKKTETKYGRIACLWNKKQNLERFAKYPIKAVTRHRNEELSLKLRRTEKNIQINPKYLGEKLKIKPKQVYSLIRHMNNKNQVINLQRGYMSLRVTNSGEYAKHNL